MTDAPPPASPELPDAPRGPLPPRSSDYAHARHAGNAGDVFKHLGLAALLGAFPEGPALYAESHAGDGLYSLGSVGEWTGGAARIWAVPGGGALGRYLSVLRSFSPEGAARPLRYPGSPLLVRALRPAARLALCELDAQAATLLRRALEPGPTGAGAAGPAEVREADGFAALPGLLAAAGMAPAVALIDPPYSGKQEWAQAAACVAAACAAAPKASLLLWYPVRALTRPRALLAELAGRGLHGTVVELITTPLRLKREKLNGSGLVFLGPPAGAVEELCAQLPRLGPALATHGEWSAVQIGF